VTLLHRVVACALLSARPGPLDVEAYRERLLSLEARLLSRDRAEAAQEARALLEEGVLWGSQKLPVDRSVLLPIVEEREGVVGPLQALIAALPSSVGAASAPRLDRPALSALALRMAEAPKGLADETSLSALPFQEQLKRLFKSAASWVKERLREAWRWLVKWFKKWWQRPVREETVGAGLVPLVVVGAGVILLLVALAALLSLRSRPDVPVPKTLAPAKDVDADPLSRTGNEWVERAETLSREGRYREAIRAWYHALLVSCYRSGLLHHRPGLTNWEYARSLGPDLPWRGQFAELTGRFDLEWYGRAQSSAEALEAFAGETGVLLGALEGARP
jgi:Domain of unknown function (DUF4129)